MLWRSAPKKTVQEYRTRGGGRKEKWGQQLPGRPPVHYSNQAKGSFHKEPAVLCLQLRTNLNSSTDTQSLHAAAWPPLDSSLALFSPYLCSSNAICSSSECAPRWPLIHVPPPLPNCKSFLLLPILSSTPEKGANYQCKNKGNYLRQSLHYQFYHH